MSVEAASEHDRVTGAKIGGAQTEFSMSEKEFDGLRAVIKDLTGISMGASKRQLIYRRLSGRLKENRLTSFDAYMDYLKQAPREELEVFTNAVTTNLTSFFREQHHFDYLTKSIIPELQASKGHNTRHLRIWSAGCSTGEEPYSIAMTLRDNMKDIARWDARVLATDLDTDVLNTGKNGIYHDQRVEKMPQDILQRWFSIPPGGAGQEVRVKRELQDLIAFRQLNLMDKWPMKGRFDIIFCRNVIIYFDKPTQRVLMNRYADILEDGGYLILGHSESLFNVSDRFDLIGKTIYRKCL